MRAYNFKCKRLSVEKPIATYIYFHVILLSNGYYFRFDMMNEVNMMRRSLNPTHNNIAIDANSLDPIDDPGELDVKRLLILSKEGKINLIVPKGVRREFQNPRTPLDVKEIGLIQLHTLHVPLIKSEQDALNEIVRVLRGNALGEKHIADARVLRQENTAHTLLLTISAFSIDRASYMTFYPNLSRCSHLLLS